MSVTAAFVLIVMIVLILLASVPALRPRPARFFRPSIVLGAFLLVIVALLFLRGL
jgi:hypothetical protein